MHQFVQSAIEAAKQGDNTKALSFLKQVLNANPNDVDAWLVLAAVVDDPARKRNPPNPPFLKGGEGGIICIMVRE